MKVNLDAKLAGADWTKGVWDLAATNVTELRQTLVYLGMTPREFKRLPLYRQNVARLPWLAAL